MGAYIAVNVIKGCLILTAKKFTYPKIGFGCATLGSKSMPESVAMEMVETAYEHGIRYFDTAHLYGGGVSEERLGRALKGISDPILLSTKIGRYREYGGGAAGDNGPEPIFDLSADRTMRSIELSLDRLNRDMLDLVYLHDIENHIPNAVSGALTTLQELKSQGVISMIGVGSNSADGLLQAIEEIDPDCILIAGRWTLLDRTGKSVIELCKERKISVSAGAVLNSGILATGPVQGAKFNYQIADADKISRTKILDDICRSCGIELLDAALQFPLLNRTVSNLLLGADNPDQLIGSLERLNTELPADFWNEIDNSNAFIV